jgi:peptidoglycan/LPS O-acetylase OafA/YrhL
VSRLSQFIGKRPAHLSPRRAKIKVPDARRPEAPGSNGLAPFGGTFLSDMLHPDRNSFAIIRMAMALAVLVSHSYWFAFGTTGSQPLVKWTGHSLGEHAVQVFFLLSGILVAQSLHRSGNIVDYVCARALRIFPALAVCVFLTAFVLGPMVTNLGLDQYFRDHRVAAYIVKTLSLSTGSAPLPGVFTDVPLANYVNVSLWTLKFEVLCYIALALLGVIGLTSERFRVWSAIGLGLFVSLIFLRMPIADAKYTALDNIRYLMVFFFTGVLAFQCRQWLFVHGLLVLPLAGLFLLSIGTRFVEISSAVFLGYTMLWLSTFSFGGLRAFTNKNDYSYGTYIYAGPIQQMIVHFLPGFSPLVVTGFAVGIAVPLAVYSWELIERPALALRDPVRNWLLGLGDRASALASWLVPVRAVATATVPHFAAQTERSARTGGAAGPILAGPRDVPVATAVSSRRQRRPTLVATGANAPGEAEVLATIRSLRRVRRAQALTIARPVGSVSVPIPGSSPMSVSAPMSVTPEVAAMHQSKAFAEALQKSRSQNETKSAYSTGDAAFIASTSASPRTPYARNWLMALAWLDRPIPTRVPARAPVDQAQPSAVSLAALAEFRNRNAKPQTASQMATQTAAPSATARRLPITPVPATLATTPGLVAADPATRGGLMGWLSALAGRRQPAGEPSEPAAEIPADRLAQALRPRTQSRPKWKAPANDQGNDPLPV